MYYILFNFIAYDGDFLYNWIIKAGKRRTKDV